MDGYFFIYLYNSMDWRNCKDLTIKFNWNSIGYAAIAALNKEYIDLLASDEGNPSDRFWMLEEHIKKDKKHPGVRIEMRKSNVIYDIAGLVAQKIITPAACNRCA